MSSRSGSFRLPRRRVLKKRSEIRQVLKQGRRIAGRNINLFVLSQPRFPSRIAIVVPRRIGSAVQRNRIKRLLREIYRRHPGWFDDKQVVFSIKRFTDDYHQLEKEVQDLVSRT